MDTKTITAAATAFNSALTAYCASLDIFNYAPKGNSEEHDRALEIAWLAAERAALSTPAQTIDDVRAKMEILFQDPMAQPPVEQIMFVMQDLVRLTNYTPSRVFCAKTWVNWFARHGGMWHVDGNKVTLLNIESADLKDHLFTLAACNGREQVEDYIRQHSPALEEAA